jgi:arylsulfatase A-like enzyme
VSAIRAGNWKLLEYFEDGRRELYNLEPDPYETTNLAEKEPQTLDALTKKLRTWREEVGANLPQANSAFKGKK